MIQPSINLPRKTVTLISNLKDLPEPFKTYWEDRVPDDDAELFGAGHNHHLHRNYAFYLVDGELYIQDREYNSELLHHWTQDSCAGISLYADSLGHPEHGAPFPYVRLNGEYLFECRQTASYETSVISPVDGKTFVVHDG
jgi:hypothetical protein